MNLRFRLALGTVAVAATSVVALTALLWLPLRAYNQSLSTSDMLHVAQATRLQLQTAGARGITAPEVLEQAAASNQMRLLVVGARGRVLLASAPAPVTVQLPARTASNLLRLTIDGRSYLGAAVPIGPQASLQSALHGFPAGGQVVAARLLTEVDRGTTSQLLAPLLLAGLAALAAAALVGTLLSRSLTTRLTRLRDAVRGIAGGDYGRRVDFSGGDEIAELGTDFDRMAGQLEASHAAQRAFLASFSHELRTPLTSVLGFSEALLDGSASGEEGVRRAAGIINTEAGRLLRLSQDLVDLARIEAGAVSLRPIDLDLREQLEAFRHRMAPRAERTGLRWSVAIPKVPLVVRADPDRVQQILDNLGENAIRYADPGGEVTLMATAQAESAVVTMSNPAAQVPQPLDLMFERFYRADPARTDHGGAGLGLPVARELARLMGGDLRASTREGLIKFQLLLPVAAPPDPKTRNRAIALRRDPESH